VRQVAIHNLILFSKMIPRFASRVADALVQLLQSGIELIYPESPAEVTVVRESLLASFRYFWNDSSLALFHQIQHGTESVKNATSHFFVSVLLPNSNMNQKLEYLAKLCSV
jgi:hypothetical protein